MNLLLQTPEPPYYAVIFTSRRSDVKEGYAAMNDSLVEKAKLLPGFIGEESVRDANGVGISVSYWKDPESIRSWKSDAQHQIAQRLGEDKWYTHYSVRICKVERDKSFALEE